MKIKWPVLILSALLAFNISASAQWQTPANSVPVGRGSGVVGFNYLAPGANNNCITFQWNYLDSRNLSGGQRRVIGCKLRRHGNG